MDYFKIDEDVAKNVMRWIEIDGDWYQRILRDGRYLGSAFVRDHSFTPTVRIQDAWLVLGMMNKKGYLCKQENWQKEHFITFSKNGESFSYLADTAQLGICVAALKAHSVEVS